MRPAEAAALDLLDRVWQKQPDGDLFVLAIDPAAIADEIGVRVHYDYMADNVSGALVKRPNRDPEILVNAGDSLVRQRFTIAHELGHLDMRGQHSKAGDEWGYIDNRDQLASRGTNKAEIYANQFAAELLMPHQNVQMLTRGQAELNAMALAAEFRVSVGAMSYRLDNLGLI